MGYYLMIKEAVDLNKKYLCKCMDNKDHIAYKGSGKLWRRILKKHNPVIKTTILGHYNTNEELRAAGEYYSDLFDVVDSSDWANLIPEIGDGGSTTKGKTRCYDSKTGEERILDIVPDGWIRGNKNKTTINKVRYHHSITKEYKMFSKNEEIAKDWIKGGIKGLYSYGPRKGTSNIYNNGTSNIYLSINNLIPEGFTKGSFSSSTGGKIGYHHIITKKMIYLDKGSAVPDGYAKGSNRKTTKPPKIIKYIQISNTDLMFSSVESASKFYNLTRWIFEKNYQYIRLTKLENDSCLNIIQ